MTENPPGLDLDRLQRYLDQARPGLLAGAPRAELIAGGRSNLTYRLTDGAHRWVLRRPPLGHVLATAHDMVREHRVISALTPTEVPVPHVELLCVDDSVLGAPFYLMEHVDGVPIRSRADAAWLSSEHATALSTELVDVLARLHAVDPTTVGLADFGRPEGFLDRQVSRWHRQLAASRSREVAEVDALHEVLVKTVPNSARSTIVHGDYRLDNVLAAADPVRISAVLDWEMATLGDPLTDLGLLVVYWRGFGKDADAITGGVTGGPGFLTVADLVECYVQRSGADVSALTWYVAFACFKLAVILEGIHFRYTQGKTVGKGFETLGAAVRPLAEGGLAAAKDPNWFYQS